MNTFSRYAIAIFINAHLSPLRMQKTLKYGISGLAATVLSAGLFCCSPKSPQSVLEIVVQDERKIEQACDYARGLENQLYSYIINKDARKAVVTYNCLKGVVESLPVERRSEFTVAKYARPAELLGTSLGVMSKAHILLRQGNEEGIKLIDATSLQALQTEKFELSKEECLALSVIGKGMWYALHNPNMTQSDRECPYLEE